MERTSSVLGSVRACSQAIDRARQAGARARWRVASPGSPHRGARQTGLSLGLPRVDPE